VTAARRERAIMLAVGGLLAAGLTIAFAIQVGLWTIGTASHSGHRVLAGPFKALRIDSGMGDVRLVAGSGRDVTIDSHAEATLRVPRLAVSAEGSHVRVSGGCPAFALGPCHTTTVVHVPPGVPVQVRAASGDISASGLSARVRLVTSSGDVSADDLTASRVTASSNSGDVALEFTAPPRAVTVRGHSGDVHVVVPASGGPYDVDAETTSGSVADDGVAKSARSDRVITAHTNSGDVTVESD
jgi:hypothetical protein